MASIRDVARRANVGATTVSRVLNGNGYVSEETRKKIECAMKELNYTPNELARNLFHKKTGIIGVIVPDASHPFFGELVKNIESLLYARGYKMMLCNTVEDQNNEKEYLNMLNRHIVDGIITGCHTLETEEYRQIKKPIVALDRDLGEYIPIVMANHKKGGELAAHCLLKSGCRCVAQFVESTELASPYQERHRSFERVMRQNGAEVYSFKLEWNKFDSSYFEKVTQSMFELHPEVDGVFGADMLAAGYLKEALVRGKRVPQDIRIVAYDGTYITSIVTPPLTAVVQPISEIARQSVQLIIDMIGGVEYRNKKVIVDVEVRSGGTT